MLLAIDPGTRCMGWSVWSTKLERCGLVRTKAQELGDRVYELVRQLPSGGDYDVLVEKPRIYPYERKRQPNDLIDLSFAAGSCTLLGRGISVVLPYEWKGQTPKDVCHRRIMERLGVEELLVVRNGLVGVPASYQHNVLDAIGIGRWRVTGERL